MTILSKQALNKIREEALVYDKEDPDNIDTLLRELDEKIEEKKESRTKGELELK